MLASQGLEEKQMIYYVKRSEQRIAPGVRSLTMLVVLMVGGTVAPLGQGHARSQGTQTANQDSHLPGFWRPWTALNKKGWTGEHKPLRPAEWPARPRKYSLFQTSPGLAPLQRGQAARA